MWWHLFASQLHSTSYDMLTLQRRAEMHWIDGRGKWGRSMQERYIIRHLPLRLEILDLPKFLVNHTHFLCTLQMKVSCPTQQK